jgi:predicted ATPase
VPRQQTTLTGREQELDEIRTRLVHGSHRFLTLTGAGGIGKTRLALQTAAEVLRNFPDGAFLVALAPLTDPRLVLATIAQALNVRETAGSTLEATLKNHLSGRTLLVVLDNVEHVLAGVPSVAHLLSGTPGIKVLATSREPLAVDGEQVFPVPPLTADAAMSLFVERAQAVRPSFELTDTNTAAVEELCGRLDGLPLALELAAARIVLFSPAGLLARLDGRLRLLASGRRDSPERHQTLEAAIGWSYELLSPPRKALFAQLSVFRGGWTLEAAEAVCDSDLDVVDGLGSLIDKSLVQRQGTDEEPRFVMLETIHSYALERLVQSEDIDRLRDRHLGWAIDVAERAGPQLRGPDQGVWLERLQCELDNFRGALAWSVEREDLELSLRIGSALVEFWTVRADWKEGRTWLERALALPGQADAALRMKALRAVGELADVLSDYSASATYYQQSLALARELGDPHGTADALLGLVHEAERVGRYAEARECLEEAVALLSELGDEPSMARSLGGLAYLENDFRRARTLWSDTLEIHRRLANRENVGWTLVQVGYCAEMMGNYTDAGSAYAEGLSIARELGYERMTARCLTQLGEVALLKGDPDAARPLFEESMPIWRAIGHRSGLVDALRGMGDSARLSGELTEAAALLEESRAVCHEIGAVPLEAKALQSLGALAIASGQLSQADTLLIEALAHWSDMDDVAGAAESLRLLGEVAAARQDFGRAAQLLGASEAFREKVGAAVHPVEQESLERSIAVVRTALGDETFHQNWTAGLGMEVGAVAYRRS